MPAYNFQPQFEDPIMADEKRHTIRAKRKRRPKVGDTCYLFVGMRRKGCRRLKARRCVKVQDIRIFTTVFNKKTARLLGMASAPAISIDDVLLKRDEYEPLARSDGFPTFSAMMEFWKGRLPFRGDLIHWESDAEYLARIKALTAARANDFLHRDPTLWRGTIYDPKRRSPHKRRF